MSAALEQMIKGCLECKRYILNEEESRLILSHLKIPVVTSTPATTKEAAVKAANEIGYPVVAKILSADIVHKTDIGGVELGIRGPKEMENAWDSIIFSVARKAPTARIEGVLVQRQVPDGIQVVLGGIRDANFGPVVMFGLGGIYAEAFGDVVFRMAPLTEAEAADMIASTRISTILTGLRGQQPVDLELLYKVLIALGQALLDWSWLKEIEINPMVLWPGQGGEAVDALITLGAVGPCGPCSHPVSQNQKSCPR